MQRDDPFLIWTPQMGDCDDPDRAIALMNTATDQLDHLIRTGEGADIVLDCISDMGFDPVEYVEGIESFLGI